MHICRCSDQLRPVQLVWPCHYSGESLLPRAPQREGKRPPFDSPFCPCPQGTPRRSCSCFSPHAWHKRGEKPSGRKWSGGSGSWRGNLPTLLLRGEVSNATPACGSHVTDSGRAWNQEVLTAPTVSPSRGYPVPPPLARRAEVVLRHWTGSYLSQCCIKHVAGAGKRQAAEQTRRTRHTAWPAEWFKIGRVYIQIPTSRFSRNTGWSGNSGSTKPSRSQDRLPCSERTAPFPVTWAPPSRCPVLRSPPHLTLYWMESHVAQI